MVSLWHELDHKLRVLNSSRNVPHHLRTGGTISGNGTAEMMKFLLIYNNHFSYARVNVLARLQPTFSISEPLLHSRELPANH
ncbi:hypothetical protein D3C71_2059130 [compost metagenome]